MDGGEKPLRSPEERNLLQFSSFAGLGEDIQSPQSKNRFCRVMTEISGSKGPQPFSRVSNSDLSHQSSNDSPDDSRERRIVHQPSSAKTFGVKKKTSKANPLQQRVSASGDGPGRKKKMFHLGQPKASSSSESLGRTEGKDLESLSSSATSAMPSPREIKRRDTGRPESKRTVQNCDNEGRKENATTQPREQKSEEMRKPGKIGIDVTTTPDDSLRSVRKQRSFFSRVKVANSAHGGSSPRKVQGQVDMKHSASCEDLHHLRNEDGNEVSGGDDEAEINSLKRKKSSLREILDKLKNAGSSNDANVSLNSRKWEKDGRGPVHTRVDNSLTPRGMNSQSSEQALASEPSAGRKSPRYPPGPRLVRDTNSGQSGDNMFSSKSSSRSTVERVSPDQIYGGEDCPGSSSEKNHPVPRGPTVSTRDEDNKLRSLRGSKSSSGTGISPKCTNVIEDCDNSNDEGTAKEIVKSDLLKHVEKFKADSYVEQGDAEFDKEVEDMHKLMDLLSELDQIK